MIFNRGESMNEDNFVNAFPTHNLRWKDIERSSYGKAFRRNTVNSQKDKSA